MSIHEDTLRGLQEALEYVRGDKTKGKESIVEISSQDIGTKYSLLPDPDKQLVDAMIDKLLIASGQ